MIAKTFRQAFTTVMPLAGGRFSARLTGIFKAITAKSKGIRGQRPITLTENRVQLVNVEFNDHCWVPHLFTGQYTTTHSADRTTGSITLQEVLLCNAAQAPAGATHIVFTQALGIVSNYIYDADQQCYVPADAVLDKLQAVTHSEFIALNDEVPLSLTLDTVLPGSPVLNEDVSVVQCFGVSYYQLMRGHYQPLQQSQAIKIVSAF